MRGGNFRTLWAEGRHRARTGALYPAKHPCLQRLQLHRRESFWILTTVVFGIATGCLAQAGLAARAEVAWLPRTVGVPDSAAALQRVESSVEAMAIELERVAEHQRFATQMLTNQARGAR